MVKSDFIQLYLPPARKAGEAFRLNPSVILAQAALESGWGQSELSTGYNNFFGLTAYGLKNAWWPGESIELAAGSLSFRVYPDPESSFMDYARLIRKAYPPAADVSYSPSSFAQKISYSKYISEVNSDNREAYRKALVSICRSIDRSASVPSVSSDSINNVKS